MPGARGFVIAGLLVLIALVVLAMVRRRR